MGILHFVGHRIFKIRNELQEVYLNQVIQTSATSLIGIFIPIYIIALGLGFTTAIIFILVHTTSVGLLSPLAAKIASKLGLKHTILYRVPITLLFYFLLIVLGMFPSFSFVVCLAMISAFSDALYWVSLNSEFVKYSDSIHSGEETSHLVAFPKMVTIIAPIAGAIVLDIVGFPPLFILVILLMGLSVAPLFATKDHRKFFSFKFSDLKNRLRWPFYPSFFSRGWVFMMERTIWPIWIYLTFADFFWVGIVAAVTGIGISVFTLLIGKISDKFNKKKLLRMGAILYALIWFIRPFTNALPEAIALSLMGGMAAALVAVPLFSSFSDSIREKNILNAVTQREMTLSSGRIVCLILVLLAPFNIVFALVGLVALLMLI